eukprot:853217-Amorphochlora_amoeboformis.AAC.3
MELRPPVGPEGPNSVFVCIMGTSNPGGPSEDKGLFGQMQVSALSSFRSLIYEEGAVMAGHAFGLD